MSNAINQNGTGLEQQIAGLDLNEGNTNRSSPSSTNSNSTSAARYVPPHLRGSGNNESFDTSESKGEKEFKSYREREYPSDFRRGSNRSNHYERSDRTHYDYGNYPKRKVFENSTDS